MIGAKIRSKADIRSQNKWVPRWTPHVDAPMLGHLRPSGRRVYGLKSFCFLQDMRVRGSRQCCGCGIKSNKGTTACCCFFQLLWLLHDTVRSIRDIACSYLNTHFLFLYYYIYYHLFHKQTFHF